MVGPGHQDLARREHDDLLAGIALAAARTLVRLLDDPDPTVQLQAARLILDLIGCWEQPAGTTPPIRLIWNSDSP